MKHTAKSQVQTISEWLDIATKDLVPSAKQRITREIQSHYTDALQAHVEENQNPSNASTTALNELGNPFRAAKIYRKKYLTLKEDEEIRNLVALSARPDVRSGIACILWACLVLWFLLNPWHQTIGNASIIILASIGFGLAYGVVPFLKRRIFRRFPSRRATDRILLLEPLQTIGLGLIPSFAFGMLLPWYWWIVVACVSMAASLYHWLPIRSKFLKTAE